MRWLLAALIVLAASVDSRAQTTQYYGPQGQWLGSANTFGTTTQYYGPQGQWLGNANRLGPTTQFYGPQGWQGMATGPVAPMPMSPWMPALPTWGR